MPGDKINKKTSLFASVCVVLSLTMSASFDVYARQPSGELSPYRPNIWSSLGPEGGFIRTLAMDLQDPETLYVGIYAQGVFKSTDGGGNWGATENSPGNSIIIDLAVDPQLPATLYAATTTEGIFKIFHVVAIWTPANNVLYHLSVMALAIDPLDSAT